MKFIIFYVILFFILILYSNYYYGKKFHQCKTSDQNEIFYIDVEKLPNELIVQLKNALNHGSKLNPTINFNNAKGSKLEYNQIPLEIQSFYENDYYKNEVSNSVGEQVYYADENEKYRIFARMYKKGDFLDWHYDNNFTVGNRYTLVIPVLVENNTSEFMVKDRKTGEERIVPIPIGKGVIYNGSITYHKIKKQMDGLRLVIIIPFYTNPNKTIIGEIREQVRNITDYYLTI